MLTFNTMKKTIIILKSICFLSLSFFKLYAAEGNLSKSIANSYLRSFPSEKIEEAPDFTAEDKKNDFDIQAIRPPKLGEQTVRTVIFNTILVKSSEMKELQENMQNILNQYAWGDLKLFYGSTSAIDYSLMNNIDKTITIVGEAVLAALLVTPTSNIDELIDRQHVIKTFFSKKKEVKYIRSVLKEYKDSENSLLSLYSPYDPLYTREYRKYMEDYYYAKNNDPSNKNAGWLEFKKRFFRDFWGVSFNFIYPYLNACLNEIFVPILGHSDKFAEGSPSERKQIWIGATPIYGGFYKWDTAKEEYKKRPHNGELIDTTKGKMGLIFGCILPEVLWTYSAYRGVMNYLEYSSTLRNLAIRMSDIQVLVKTLSNLSEYIANDPELEKLYSSKLLKIRKLLAKANDGTEVGNLIKYLIDLPYKKWSYFFNNAGKLLASHTLFVENKDEFANAMFELGQLDAYTSVALLVQESQEYDGKHNYTFTKFLDRKERSKPYIKLVDMWNPFLDAKIAVGNDIEMGDTVRNITLTGPNAGGKSTFLTGVTTCILLSQSFGIAPAKEATITPFDKINTYIDIADDIAAGNSLFMAEVLRAQAHIAIIKNLKKSEFAFTIFDEPFSGTNPTEGAAAEYSILEALAIHENSLTIVATHYPIVMLLEDNAKDLGFANYKVFITEEGHKLNYSYKVIPGKSTQAIAIRILEEQGFDVNLLHRAKDIIKNPQNYLSKF